MTPLLLKTAFFAGVVAVTSAVAFAQSYNDPESIFGTLLFYGLGGVVLGCTAVYCALPGRFESALRQIAAAYSAGLIPVFGALATIISIVVGAIAFTVINGALAILGLSEDISVPAAIGVGGIIGCAGFTLPLRRF